jgi:hypothetical protein
MSEPVVTYDLNRPQARFHAVQANINYCLMARGTGKTTGIGAPYCLHKVENMPGSSGGLVCRSFADGESKILKPLFTGFKKQGHVLGKDFFYGKKPPEHWIDPLIPIIDWKRVISFPNGTTMQMISLHEEASANSNSFQWVYGPEAKYFNQKQLEGEIMPTLRGLYNEFGDSPWYMSQLWESDKYSPDIHWLLDKKKLHDEEKVSAVIFYQTKLNMLRAQLLEVADSTADKIRAKMKAITKVLNIMRRNLVYYGEANAYDNIQNIGQQYLDNLRVSMTDYAYRVSVLNEDPTRSEHGWYADRSDEHLYDALVAEDTSKPLIIASDYQASISPIVAAQVNDMVIPGVRTLNFVNAMYVLHPKGLKHMVDLFCDHYEDRYCKEVVYLYDHTAVSEDSARKPYHEEVEQAFRARGWKITGIHMGEAPFHSDKHRMINTAFREMEEKYMPIRMHKVNCVDMIMSMDMAEVKTGTAAQKDKSSEKKWRDGFPQQLATHFSDVFDQIAWGVLELKVYSDVPMGGTMAGFRS